MAKLCSHLESITQRDHAVQPTGKGCEECLANGEEWVHLRLCLDCGHVGCCDSSPRRHARAHAHASGHPVIRSYEPGEDWAYCFVDEQQLDQAPAFPTELPERHYPVPYL